MSQIQLFLQCEGHPRIEMVTLSADASVTDLLAAARRCGLASECAEAALVFGPEGDDPLQVDLPLNKQGIRDKHRVHVHRCRQIEVTLHFNELTEQFHFPPSATIDRVKRRFVHKIGMTPVDATEHVLQLCSSSDRPETDIQIGSLVKHCCSLCFNLVPIKRIEG